jgi:hypothetical protein
MVLVGALMMGSSSYAAGSKSCNPLATAVKNIALFSMMQPRKKGKRFSVSYQDAKMLPTKAGKKIDLGNGLTAISLKGNKKTRKLKIMPSDVRGGASGEELSDEEIAIIDETAGAPVKLTTVEVRLTESGAVAELESSE